MKSRLIFVLVLSSVCLFSQSPETYIDKDGDTHVCGPLTIEDLAKKPYSKWFEKGYEAFEPELSTKDWAKNLADVSVEIYLGTWCGDSKRWVPKFVKLWDELGLERSRLSFVGLYDGDAKYKQGPNGEEKGKGIHRVPTMIFQRDGQEIGRFVEHPVTNLETDIAQISLGYPTAPNYRAATYMIKMFEENTAEEIEKSFRTHLNSAYKLVGKSSELNTLGYVYLRSGQFEKALTTFRLNTRFFSTNPNVYDSYAEALALYGDTKTAIENYEKVLELDKENKNALAQLKVLKGKK